VVDTRERNRLDFSRFEGWFAGVETRALELGDYSIAGLEDRCVVERKDLPDLICSFTAERPVFVHRLRLMSEYSHRLLVITTALSQVKSLQPYGGGSPNRLTQSPIAVLAGLKIPFLCTESHELGEEMVA
jgi:ERCC4-type nuclease